MNKELIKNLETIVEEINNWDKCGDYVHCFNLEDDSIFYTVVDNENDPIYDFELDIDLLEEDYSCSNIIWQFIQLLYTEEINHRKKFINGTKSFNSRKIKSLGLWYERNNLEKVDSITKELIERSKIKETLSHELVSYTSIVSSLYKTRSMFEVNINEIE